MPFRRSIARAGASPPPAGGRTSPRCVGAPSAEVELEKAKQVIEVQGNVSALVGEVLERIDPDEFVRIDERYYLRPTSTSLLGDAVARSRLDWEPAVTFEELVRVGRRRRQAPRRPALGTRRA